MARDYATPAAFRAALEQRIKADAAAGGLDVARARKVAAFSRLLARLEAVAPGQWVLKGGFALQLRLQAGARTTRDIDIDWGASMEVAVDALLDAADHDLDDFFAFSVQRTDEVPDVGAVGGARFRATASVAGRVFEVLPIDLGITDDPPEAAEWIAMPESLGFAGIPSPQVPALPLERHLAEKFHAYTRTYGGGQQSSRPKDLIDMVLIAGLASFDAQSVRAALARVFEERDTHALPAEVPDAPPDYQIPYARLASAVGIESDPARGVEVVRRLLEPILSGSISSGTWDSRAQAWA